jgi:hypothetical protein
MVPLSLRGDSTNASERVLGLDGAGEGVALMTERRALVSRVRKVGERPLAFGGRLRAWIDGWRRFLNTPRG